MAQFVVYLVRRCYGVGDRLAQQVTVAPSQAMGGDFDSSLRHLKAYADLSIRGGVGVTGEDALEFLKEQQSIRFNVLFAQAFDGLLKQGHGPSSLEDPLRGGVVCWLERIPRFCALGLKGDRVFPPAPFLCSSTVSFVRNEMPERYQQEGTKSASVAMDVS